MDMDNQKFQKIYMQTYNFSENDPHKLINPISMQSPISFPMLPPISIYQCVSNLQNNGLILHFDFVLMIL